MDLQKVNDAVEVVLQKYEKARGSDFRLIVLTLKQMGFNLSTKERKLILDLDEVKNYPSFESITRCRRKFQSDKKYLPEEKIIKLRKEREEELKNFVIV